MTTRAHPSHGAPCWIDLVTSDVEAIRTFYAALFGWEALPQSPEFHGYFMFAREGVPIAGGASPMSGEEPGDVWRTYLSTSNIASVLRQAPLRGATAVMPAMAVGDLGIQAILKDPGGAQIGFWEPGVFPGFTVLGEPGSPSWFELVTTHYEEALEFYSEVAGWRTTTPSDTSALRYCTVPDPVTGEPMAGISDRHTQGEGGGLSAWSVAFEVQDVAASSARVAELGGRILDERVVPHFGEFATVTDPCGARFTLRRSPGRKSS